MLSLFFLCFLAEGPFYVVSSQTGNNARKSKVKLPYDNTTDLLLYDNGDYLADRAYNFVLDDALYFTTYYLTYLSLYYSFNLISDDIYYLLLYSNL